MRQQQWAVLGLIAATAALFACSGGDDGGDDPMDPPDPGNIVVNVTGDGDPLAGVTVRLFPDGGATAQASGTTAASGSFTFSNVTAGNYDVDVVVLAGYELAAGQAARVDVAVGESETENVGFALEEIVIAPTEGSIRARVVEGATGVAGVSVSIFEAGGGTAIQTLATGADGRVLFSGLDPADYDVEFEVPNGFEVAEDDTTRKEVTVTAGAVTDVQFEVVEVVTPVVEISASGTSFSPNDVTIDAGTTVRWVKGTNPHTVTPDGHTEWSEVTLDDPGETFEHTFNTPGEFEYHCEFHVGMMGVVTVE